MTWVYNTVSFINVKPSSSSWDSPCHQGYFLKVIILAPSRATEDTIYTGWAVISRNITVGCKHPGSVSCVSAYSLTGCFTIGTVCGWDASEGSYILLGSTGVFYWLVKMINLLFWVQNWHWENSLFTSRCISYPALTQVFLVYCTLWNTEE